MPGMVPKYKEGPITYEVAAPVTGGQLVIFDGSEPGKVNVAGAAAGFVLGVAATDARPVDDADQSYTTPSGYPAHDASVPGPYTAVHHFGCFPLTSAAAVSPGGSVEAAADGQVQPAETGAVVGVVVNPGGAAAGEEALVRLQLT